MVFFANYNPLDEIEKMLNISKNIIFSEKTPAFKLYILKLSKLSLHKLLQTKLKSKTWDEHLKLSKIK